VVRGNFLKISNLIMDDDLLFLSSSLHPKTPLKAREEACVQLAFGIYPPGMWATIPSPSQQHLCELVCATKRPSALAGSLGKSLVRE
jgi:hypothetical protein